MNNKRFSWWFLWSFILVGLIIIGRFLIPSPGKNINSTSSIVQWTYKTGGHILASPTLGDDDTIYIGSYDGKMYAIKPDGNLKWDFATGGQVFSGVSIGGQNLYFGTNNGDFYALNKNGHLVWKFKTDDSINSTAAKYILLKCQGRCLRVRK